MLFNMHMYRVNPTQTNIPTRFQQDNTVITHAGVASYYRPPLLLYKLTPKATQTHKQTVMQLSGTQKAERRRTVPW